MEEAEIQELAKLSRDYRGKRGHIYSAILERIETRKTPEEIAKEFGYSSPDVIPSIFLDPEMWSQRRGVARQANYFNMRERLVKHLRQYEIGALLPSRKHLYKELDGPHALINKILVDFRDQGYLKTKMGRHGGTYLIKHPE